MLSSTYTHGNYALIIGMATTRALYTSLQSAHKFASQRLKLYHAGCNISDSFHTTYNITRYLSHVFWRISRYLTKAGFVLLYCFCSCNLKYEQCWHYSSTALILCQSMPVQTGLPCQC